MLTKKSPFSRLMMIALLAGSLTFTGCADTEEAEETKIETSTIDAAPPEASMKDTMDTADTRPIVKPNAEDAPQETPRSTNDAPQ